MDIILQSDRLNFREFTEADAQLVYDLNSAEAVLKYIHEAPASDLNSALRTIRERIIPQYREHGYGRWALHLKSNNAFIGWCGLKYRPESGETDLGYRLMQNAWNQGYASEAAKASLDFGFNQLGLPAITARAQLENVASLRVLEKVGMQFIEYDTVDGLPVKTYHLSASQFRP